MTTANDKIVAYVDGQPIKDPSECFAVRGLTIIDVLNPDTGLTAIYGKKLEDCRKEKGYEQAERMTIDEFCRSKAEVQDTPVSWEPVTEETFDDMLNVLPPAYMGNGGFLVGEAWDHHALTGQPRYAAYRKHGGVYETASRPMTIKEFKVQP